MTDQHASVASAGVADQLRFADFPGPAAAPASRVQVTGVVVGVDDSASARAAVAWAATAAGRRDLALHLVEVLPGSARSGAPDGIAGSGSGTPRRRARALLSRARDIAQAAVPGLSVSVHTRYGRVGPTLVDFAAQASLLVVGCNGPGGPIPLSLGSIVGAVTRRCACPVVLVPAPARARGHAATGPVLVALEQGPDGERALSVAADVASRRGVALRALVSPAESTEDTTNEPSPAAAQLARLREQYPALPIEHQPITVRPADALLASDRHAAMLVVPSLPRRPSRGRPAASWTGHFLPILSSCPVVVISARTRPSTSLT